MKITEHYALVTTPVLLPGQFGRGSDGQYYIGVPDGTCMNIAEGEYGNRQSSPYTLVPRLILEQK